MREWLAGGGDVGVCGDGIGFDAVYYVGDAEVSLFGLVQGLGEEGALGCVVVVGEEGFVGWEGGVMRASMGDVMSGDCGSGLEESVASLVVDLF